MFDVIASELPALRQGKGRICSMRNHHHCISTYSMTLQAALHMSVILLITGLVLSLSLVSSFPHFVMAVGQQYLCM